ncbi:MAG: 6-bladed beta-propeller [Clostridiales bacterium]|nr:6-bladed beta-propeller [Clostridiales bacterium]
MSFLASGWVYGDQVKIKIENGVTIVYNPRDPAPPRGVPTGLSLKEDLSVGPGWKTEESMLLNPTDVDADGAGNIYILDRTAVNIKVFDRQGKFIRAIGKKGQGPGEFQNPSDFHVTSKEEILVCDSPSRRLLLFKLDGEFLKELSAGKMWMFTRAQTDSKGNIVGSHTIMDREARSVLVRFTSSLEPLYTIAPVPIARYPVINPYFPLLYFE